MALYWFDLEHAALCVEGSSRSAQLFEWLLGPRQLSARPASTKSIKITVKQAPGGTHDLGQPLREMKIIDGQTLQIYSSNHHLMIAGVGDRLTLELLEDGSSIVSGYGENFESCPGLQDLLLLALDHAINATGQSFIHAACLTLPDETSTVLLHAKSGTGKTTTSFAMTTQGYRIFSDDAAVIHCPDGTTNPMVWGVPRAPKVHKNTAAALPFLDSYFDPRKSDLEGEQFLDRQKLVQNNLFVDSKAMRISAVVSLARDLSSPASITRVGLFDALSDMLEDNLASLGTSLLPSHENRLTAYSKVVQHCACYRVNINGTPVEAAKMISDALEATTVKV